MKSQDNGSKVTRREFLAVTGATLIVPALIPSRILGAEAPSKRITLGVVGCDFDSSGPFEVEGKGDFPPKNAVWNTCTRYRIELKYPRNITMTIAGGHPNIRGGAKWIGTKGWVWVNRGAFEGSNEEWRDYRELPEDLRKVKLYESTNHHRNFLDCVKSRKPTITPAETAHHSAIPGHLGLISMQVERELRWDAQAERILDDAEASVLLTRPFRAPWKLG